MAGLLIAAAGLLVLLYANVPETMTDPLLTDVLELVLATACFAVLVWVVQQVRSWWR